KSPKSPGVVTNVVLVIVSVVHISKANLIERNTGHNMKNESQKTNKNKKLLIIFLVIGLLLATGVIFGFVFQDNIKTIAMNIKTDIENRGKPKFIFNTEQFSDWATVG